jgi:hypothetical protein
VIVFKGVRALYVQIRRRGDDYHVNSSGPFNRITLILF